ncbi:methionyl-tRNA formyltransferase [Candidatus Dojkabacteria bacterium]|nr:methionyl-tRNA formyltransferase [Candidatus Dojkabacteria bacterium]
MQIKTLFLGSNWEAVESLKVLKNDNRFEIVGVITQPDKPSGRKQILTPSLVKQFCIENNITVFFTENNPEKYKEALELFKPELIVCKAFGEMIPGFFLEYPKYKAINIHFSILPKYRGAVPIQMAILSGEKETGVTFVQMVEKMDKGPILKIIKEEIEDDDTNQSLREKLVTKSSKELPEVLIDWVEGKTHPTVQNESEATYCYKKDVEKEKAEIKFNEMDAEYIERMVRAFIPWPIAWAVINGKRCKIFETKVAKEGLEDKNRMVFKTKKGLIEVLKLQPEGKKEMNASEYLKGNK